MTQSHSQVSDLSAGQPGSESRIKKDFPVFDCDAHVNDPLDIWERYVPAADKDLVRGAFWRTPGQAWLNGDIPTLGGGVDEFPPVMHVGITIAGPQMTKKLQRRLYDMVPLTAEQREYLDHNGAYDARARVRDLDLMGIDQVLVLPSLVFVNLPFVENPAGAAAFCRAYNNWLRDWCSEEPDRLYGAGIVPFQSPEEAVKEIRRSAESGFPVVLMRPIDAQGGYPNDVRVAMMALGGHVSPSLDIVFRTLEATGQCLGMHTFPAGVPRGVRTSGLDHLYSPGQLVNHAEVDPATMSFVYEAQTWLGQVLLSGFLDRYPRLKVVIFESNSQWLPYLLETCDRLFKLYARERDVPAKRLPSEAFYEQCSIGFEGDEEPTFAQWELYEDIGLWSSDCYHHDGADSWSAIRCLTEYEVPSEVQAKLLGGNARRLYGIEGKIFVTEEPGPIERPDWFPEQDAAFQEWCDLIADPRRNAEKLRQMGMENPLAVMAQRIIGEG